MHCLLELFLHCACLAHQLRQLGIVTPFMSRRLKLLSLFAAVLAEFFLRSVFPPLERHFVQHHVVIVVIVEQL